MRWNHQTILDEIRHLHTCGEELCFSCAESSHPHVVRAALWHFGSWKTAVEAAGFDPQISSKYRRWTREGILEAIRAHHRAGHDLSWRAVSTQIDPPLAAAARRRGCGFDSWEAALEAAGISPPKVVKYRRWTRESVIDELRLLNLEPRDFSATAVQRDDAGLYCAALRRFDSWAQALAAAGICTQKDSSPRVKISRQVTQTPEIALCAESYLPPSPKLEPELESEPDAALFQAPSHFDAREMSARTCRMAAKPDQLSDDSVSREVKSGGE